MFLLPLKRHPATPRRESAVCDSRKNPVLASTGETRWRRA
jgi:hypothetical protein